MAALKDELKGLIRTWTASAPNPTLPLLIRACRNCFSEGEVKGAVDELVADGRLELRSELVQAGGEVLALVKLELP